jgi:hypothetical protein
LYRRLNLNQPFEDVVQPSFLNREWDDLGRHRLKPVGCAIMRRKEISGQLRDSGPRLSQRETIMKLAGAVFAAAGESVPGFIAELPEQEGES